MWVSSSMRFIRVVQTYRSSAGTVRSRGAVRAARLLPVVVALVILVGPAAFGQDSGKRDSAPGEPAAGSARPQSGQAVTPPAELSAAEKIAQLRRTIEQDEKQRDDLVERLKSPKYSQAELAFTELDGQRTEKRHELEQLRDAGKAAEADALEQELTALERRWQLARDELNLLIEERKGLQQQVANLEQKLQLNREALAKLTSPAATQPAPPGETQPAAPAPSTQPAPPAGETRPAADEGKPAEPGSGGMLGIPGLSAPPGAAADPNAPAKPPSKEVVAAQEELQKKEATAQEAEAAARSLEERVAALRKSIETDTKLLETARGQMENARKTERALRDEVQALWSQGAPREQINELWSKIEAAQTRLTEARDEVVRLEDRLSRQRVELASLEAEQQRALEDAERARKEAEQAQRELETLQNPFTPHNMLQWLLDHGPRIVMILVVMFVLLTLTRLAEKRAVKLLAGRSDRGTTEERENRARTLVHVGSNAVVVVVIVGGLLLLLTEVGVNIVPLMGGAAVVGLAVGLGAQNLVRDFFSGFMILLENQYGINDVVRVGGVGGLVERITLRVTVLRDLDGTVHFVPNGEIKTVSNLTHGWSRALFDIGVSYKEDVFKVMDILMKLAKELRSDPTFRQMILEDPEMLGVDALGDSAVVIRFMIKTRAGKQWMVRRALTARIKKKFDELGIEIPFPHRTVYHRYENGAAPQARGDDAEASEQLARAHARSQPPAHPQPVPGVNR